MADASGAVAHSTPASLSASATLHSRYSYDTVYLRLYSDSVAKIGKIQVPCNARY